MAEQQRPVWSDDDLIMISALEHYSYCPRQYALIHQEQTYDENLYTLRGRAVHKQVDEPEYEVAHSVRVERALSLWSDRLGLIGRADVVEFHGATPYPVEYKHGPRRQKEHDDLQLCAQALCLEEMTGQDVPEGAIMLNMNSSFESCSTILTKRRIICGFIAYESQKVSIVSIMVYIHQSTLRTPCWSERGPEARAQSRGGSRCFYHTEK